MATSPATTGGTLIRTAQTTAIFLSASTSGASLALSALLVPRLLDAPAPLMLRQWARAVQTTKKVIPALVGAAAAGYFLLAYRFWPAGPGTAGRTLLGVGAGGSYALAGLLCVSIMPYTWAVQMPTNRRIYDKMAEMGMDEAGEMRGLAGGAGPSWVLAEAAAGAAAALADVSAEKEQSAKYLVDHWGLLNLGRAAMIAAAGLVGLSASL